MPPSRRRRGYATRMLALGLLEAASRGLDRVLLTADATNAASIKVIERNGGRFDREYAFEGVVRRRYWIDCPSPALRAPSPRERGEGWGEGWGEGCQ